MDVVGYVQDDKLNCVTKSNIQVAGNPFLKGGQTPLITVNPTTKEIVILPNITPNVFMTNLGLKNGDIIVAINGTAYNLDNIYDLIGATETWKEGDAITATFKRDDKEQTIKGTVKLPMEDSEGYHATDAAKAKLKEAWLKG